MLYRVEREVDINVPPRAFFDVVWDFETYPRFVTGIAATKVIFHEENLKRVEITAKLMGIPFRYELSCERDKDERVHWERTSGAFARAEGSWTLLETRPSGALRIRYENAVDPGLPAPGFMVHYVLETSLPKLLKEFKDRAESKVPRA